MNNNKPYVESSIQDGLATIEFYHPAHNSLPGDLLEKLRNRILEAGSRDDVILILLKSGGDRTFCAGASFNELASIKDGEEGLTFFMGFANVINAIRTCGKIVIGRIQGKAVGGGVGIAAACDYAIATKFASVKLSELAVGIGPFVIGPAVQRKIGISAFSNLAINATEWQTAEWAKSKGLFMEAFESLEQMDEYLNHFIGILLNSNPAALQEMKKMLWEGTENWNNLLQKRAAISGRLVLSEYTRQAISRFVKA
jgi:methylglutaconyl-CoA hydratase